MPYIRLAGAGVTSNSIEIVVDELQYAASTYYEIRIWCRKQGEIGGISREANYGGGGTSGNYRTANIVFSGLNGATTYEFEAQIRWESSSTIRRYYASFTTNAAPIPVPDTPSINVYSVSGKTVTFEISTGANTTGYDIYKSWDGQIASYSASSYSTYYRSFTLPSYQSSSARVRAYNQTHYSSYSNYAYFATADTTPPSVRITSTSGDNTVSVQWTASDNEELSYFHLFISSPGGTSLTLKATLSASSRSYSFLSDANGNTLRPGEQYYIRVRAYDTNGNSSDSSTYVTVSRPRPSEFYWTYTKSSGVNFNLAAFEWNNLLDKINEFRIYKGYSPINTFDRAYSGGSFFAVQFNQAVNIINTMGPPVSPPTSKYSGDVIYAEYLLRLRNALNSVA